MRLLIFVVTYNAEMHILNTLNRISRDFLLAHDYEILILDDDSDDGTYDRINKYQQQNAELNIKILKNQRNLGYGGNQKKGYNHAISNQFELVVLLHGDGQYAPEFLEQMTAPIKDGDADVVLGSRMIVKRKALEGNMPIYKWVGNQILTFLQNRILGTNLSEFHTGYRTYRIASLRTIPFRHNSDYFDFDTEILIQLIDQKARFQEIAIPTFYGDEISYVNGFKYAWLIIYATLKSRLCKWGWVQDVRFDYSQ